MRIVADRIDVTIGPITRRTTFVTNRARREKRINFVLNTGAKLLIIMPANYVSLTVEVDSRFSVVIGGIVVIQE